MNDRGWTSRRDEALQLALLDWIYESTRGAAIPRLSAFADAQPEPLDSDALEAAVAALESSGLIRVNGGLGGLRSSSAQVTERGITVLRARRDRRSNAKARAVAAREALLDWLYQQKREGVHSPILERIKEDPRGHFEGDPFTDQEISDTGEHLKARGLIKGSGGWGAPVLSAAIEPLGEEVVENFDGSLTAWASAQRGGVEQFVTRFNAPVSGQVGIGTNVTQTQNQGFDAGTLLALVQDVRESAGDVPAAEQAYFLTYLDVIQAEATNPEPNIAVIESSGGRLKGIASKAGNAGLSASVGALVQFIARAAGAG